MLGVETLDDGSYNEGRPKSRLQKALSSASGANYLWITDKTEPYSQESK